MDSILKSKTETIKFLEENLEKNLFNIVLAIYFILFYLLCIAQKPQGNKIKNRPMIFSFNQKSPGQQRQTSAKLKGSLWNGRKYLQTTYLIRG